jgi:hypothetical protein
MLEDVLNLFPILLQERLSKSRRTSKEYLSEITKVIVNCVVEYNFLKQDLDQSISKIIEDCDIFYGMTYPKALDSITELGSLACLYTDDKNVYAKINSVMKNLRLSYPPNLG